MNAPPKNEYRDPVTKRYAYFGNFERVCVCGHTLGDHISFHVDGVRVADIAPVVRANIAREAALMTDEGTQYREVGCEFARHGTVVHKDDEYVRGDAGGP